MLHALRRRVRVQPGGRIEIQDDALPEGADAEVVVLLPETAGDGAASEAPLPGTDTSSLPPLTSMIGAARGLFASPEEVDAYLRTLRDEWD